MILKFSHGVTSLCRRISCLRYNGNHTESAAPSPQTKKLYQWKQPEGHDTGVNVVNSYRCLGKRTNSDPVPLVVGNPSQVTWYSCGPTVYDKPHIGNAATYVRFDSIRRILMNHFGLDIIFILGITDIDDKIINRAALLDQEFLSLARFYEEEFKSVMHSLNVLPPTMYIRVSDVVPRIMSFIHQLLEEKKAYVGRNGNVWFDVGAFTNLGRLTYILEEWEDSETSQILTEKRSTKDFALWKGAKAGEPYWDAPWGKGRPGWHIECSTIASLVFGNKLDIHSGSQDLILHHECEIFQSESYHKNEQWVNYFLHAGSLISEGASAKMSKSLGNVVTVDEFLQSNSADCFRMFCLSNDWNSNLLYTPTSVKSAAKKLAKIKLSLNRCRLYAIGNLDGDLSNIEVARMLAQCKQSVHESLCNNFDISFAITALHNICQRLDSMFTNPVTETLRRDHIGVRECAAVLDVFHYVSNMFKLFGFKSLNVQETVSDSASSQNLNVTDDLQEFRNSVRKIANDLKQENTVYSKNLFDACDQLRVQLNKKGVILNDSKL